MSSPLNYTPSGVADKEHLFLAFGHTKDDHQVLYHRTSNHAIDAIAKKLLGTSE
jgi:hypothetical protein